MKNIKSKTIYWTPLDFGKYKWKTLPEIILIQKDANWFFENYKAKAFNKNKQLKAEAKEMYIRAQNIKIPKFEGKKMIAEYLPHYYTKKFIKINIIPKAEDKRMLDYDQKYVIDLSYPGQNILGRHLLISAIKEYVFQDKNIELTKEMCEDFFSDDKRFRLITIIKKKRLPIKD